MENYVAIINVGKCVCLYNITPVVFNSRVIEKGIIMRIISWNVNGLRACINKGFFEFFDEINADIFCIQEIKMDSTQFRHQLPDYVQYWNPAEKKGYAGTAVFAKNAAKMAVNGIGDLFYDEGRLITLEYEDYYLINCYSPHSQRNLNRLEYKMAFDFELTKYIAGLNEKKPVILCGDLNIAHQEIDLKNYKSNKENAGFTLAERSDFDAVLEKGFIDSFRYKYPEKSDAYTWWSYRKGVRERNIGWRIDYIIISDRIKEKINDCSIYSDILGSDHCPVGIDINL